MSNFLRPIFNTLPSLAGILLAALAFALVFVKELDEKLKDKRAVRWCLAIVLAAIGVTGFISDLVQKADEKTRAQNAEKEQKTAVDGFNEQLHQSELHRIADTRYMQGQLDVFVQFAPAIVKLAQATELNTRKTYEAKMLSNKDLYDATIEVVKRMRAFGQKRELESAQQMNASMAAMRNATNDAEKLKLWTEERNNSIAASYRNDAEFRASILPDAVYVRNELLRRKIPEPPSSPMHSTSSTQMVFAGILAGAYPEFDAANYLEQMAKQLRLK